MPPALTSLSTVVVQATGLMLQLRDRTSQVAALWLCRRAWPCPVGSASSLGSLGTWPTETIQGIQSRGVIACAKHYILNEQGHFHSRVDHPPAGGMTHPAPTHRVVGTCLAEYTAPEGFRRILPYV